MDEVPYRPVISLEAAPREFLHQPAQGKVPLADPLAQPNLMLASDRSRLVPAHLAGRHAPRLAKATHPVDRRAGDNPEPRRRRVPRKPLFQNRPNHPFAQIQRIRFCHPCWPPYPASILNHIPGKIGIPIRFRLKPSRSSPRDTADPVDGATVFSPFASEKVRISKKNKRADQVWLVSQGAL